MIRFKLGDSAHEAMVSLTYFKTSEEAESHNIFAKGLWKVTVENMEELKAKSKACIENPK